MEDDDRHTAHVAMMQRRRPNHFRPWESVRPDGHRLQDAILELVLPSFRETVAELLADEEVGFYGRSEGFRDHLWRHVWWRLQQGQLFTRGLELTTGAEWHSEPRMFDDAEPDFGRNRITCFGRTFASVRVYETSATRTNRESADLQYRTGVAGRPSSVHLAEAKLLQRHAAGQTLTTLATECAAIVEWLKEEHPDAPSLKPKSLSEALRTEYHKLRQKP